MESFARISRLLNSIPGTPLTFNLKIEFVPPANLILDILMLLLWWLYILNFRVLEPTVVNTVSKKRVSLSNDTVSHELVVKISFLQANKANIQIMDIEAVCLNTSAKVTSKTACN
tara:strand:+ start:36 stop:380 length:345 start_codon:yes stop_codon:yes gene_type:complete